MDLVPFAAVLFLAFLVESAVGFGSALVAVSLGAQFLPLDELISVVQPLSFVLSLILVIRDRAHVQARFLAREILPPTLPGAVVARVLFRSGPADALLLGVGVTIALFAAFELRRTLRGTGPTPLAPWLARTVLVGAGVIHGLFTTGGPPVVWVVSHALPDKATFRATLALLWLLLSGWVIVSCVLDGSLGAASLTKSAALSVPLILGYVVGNALHHRIPQRAFRLGVCVLLVVAGVVLVVRAAHALAA